MGIFPIEFVPFVILFLVVSIGASFGGLTGCATNSTRDLAPRILYSLIPMENKADPDWAYAPIPIFGPIIGGVLAVLVYNSIPWL